jgi:hypothetical protein
MDYSEKIRLPSSLVTDTKGCRVPFSASIILTTSDNNHHCILLLFQSYNVQGCSWVFVAGVQTIETPQAPRIREPKVPLGTPTNFLIEFVQISGVHLIVLGGSGPPDPPASYAPDNVDDLNDYCIPRYTMVGHATLS